MNVSLFVKHRGVTLLELLVVLAIAAILSVIALPSFTNAITSSRLAASSNELLTAVAFARSEAMRNSRGAVICPSRDGFDCGGDWHEGWIVWPDRNANGLRETAGVGAEPVLRQQSALLRQTSSGGTGAIRFTSRGAIIGTGAGAITLSASDCTSGQPFRRQVTILSSGAVRITRQNCP